MLALVRDGAEMYPVDLGDLDRDIRTGQVSPTAELLHPPWTGARFIYLTEIPQLEDAFNAPDARLCLWMRRPRRPRLSLVVALLTASAAIAQAVGATPASRLYALAETMARRGGLGFEPTLLEGAWWTPLLSQLVHDPRQPVFHMLVNLPLVAYGGYRVERALGSGGYALVAGASVLTGALAVVVFSDRVVVGSSLLGFGLWGAQIAIGFRWSTGVPMEQRAFYGWGTWLVFAPLYLLSLAGSDISHVGHLGGVLGGLLAVAGLQPESTVRDADVRRSRWLNLALAATLFALVPLLCLGLSAAPTLLSWPQLEEPVPEQSAEIDLPLRLANHPVPAFGGDAWVPAVESDQPIFLRFMAGEPEDRVAFWRKTLGGVPSSVSPGGPGPEGWSSSAWLVRDPDTGQATWIVEEWQRCEGGYCWIAGLLVRAGPADPAARMAYYRRALHDIRVIPPGRRRQAP